MFAYTLKFSTFDVVTLKALVLEELCMRIDWNCLIDVACVFSEVKWDKSVREMCAYTCKFLTFEIVTWKALVL